MSQFPTTAQTKALLLLEQQQLPTTPTMTLKAAATMAMRLKEQNNDDDAENTGLTYDAGSSSSSTTSPSEDDSESSSHDCDPDTTTITTTSTSTAGACSPVASNLAFFCRKRACLLCFCLVAMGASIVLFGVDVVYGNWVAEEENYQDDGGNTSVERSYQPGNQVTFGVLLLSIFLFQASLSTMLVLFAYQYKRDAQELHDQQQQQLLVQSAPNEVTPGLHTQADAVTELYMDLPQLQRQRHELNGQGGGITRLGFFYLKQKAFFTGIFYSLVASMICLVVSQITTSSTTFHSTLLVVGMLLLVGVYLSTVWLIHTRYAAHVEQYESIRTLKRKLSGGSNRRRRTSITYNDTPGEPCEAEEDDHSWKTVAYFWKKRELMVAHTVALLLFSIVFLILVFFLGDWSQTAASDNRGVVYLPASMATVALVVLGMMLFSVSVPMVLLAIPGCYFRDAREYNSSLKTTRGQVSRRTSSTGTIVGDDYDEYKDDLNNVV